jgi:hypothetical protein
MLQANQRIIEFLFWLRNLWSHLAWFTWTKNSINDNNFFIVNQSYDFSRKSLSNYLMDTIDFNKHDINIFINLTRGSAHWACIAHLTIEWYWSKFQREISITLKNSSHLEWRVGLSDTILKGLLVSDWLLFKKTFSSETAWQNGAKFGRKHLCKILYKASSFGSKHGHQD